MRMLRPRYPPARLKEHFATANEPDVKPRFNIAPSQTVPIGRPDEQGNRTFTMAQWGLMPNRAKDPKRLPHPINAKAETVAIKPMFRERVKRRGWTACWNTGKCLKGSG